MSQTNNLEFQPIQCTSKVFANLKAQDGFLYFVTDTKQIFLGKDNTFVNMCGGINIVYGIKEIDYDNSGLVPSPDVTFYIDELTAGQMPLENDLILNKDGCFYKVKTISEDEGIIETVRLTLQGSGGPSSGPSTDGTVTGSWSITAPFKNQSYIYSATAENMKVEFKANYKGNADGYINYIAFTFNAAMDDKTLPFYELSNINYAFGEDHTIDLIDYKDLFSTAVAKKIYINAVDIYGVVHSQSFTLRLVDLSLTAERDNIIKVGDKEYSYKCFIGGTRDGLTSKKLVFNIFNEDNLNVPIKVIEDTAVPKNYVDSYPSVLNLSDLDHGVYVMEVHLEGFIPTSIYPLSSNTLRHKLIKFSDSGSGDLLAYYLPDRIEQYTNIPLNYYLASTQNNKNYTLTVSLDGEEIAPLIIQTNVFSSHNLYFEKKGNYTLTLSIVELGIEHSTVIQIVEYNGDLPIIDPNNQYLMLYLTPKGRSNNSMDRAEWPDYHKRYTGELTDMYYSNANGWLTDPDGTAYLQLTSGSKMRIKNFQPFKQDPTQENEQNTSMGSGMTIELDFEINGITDYDADIIKCLSQNENGTNKVGFTVTGTEVKFYSALKNGTDTNPLTTLTIVEGKRIRLSFVIEPNDNDLSSDYYPMCYSYLNGIMSAAVLYNKLDSFEQDPSMPAEIRIDSTKAQIKIYGIRVYSTALRDMKILENYTASLSTLEERQDRYNSNKVLNSSTNLVDFELVSDPEYNLEIPYMVITGGYATDKDNDKWQLLPSDDMPQPGLPTDKKDYRLIDVQVVYPKYSPAVLDEDGKVVIPAKNEYFKEYKDYSYKNTFSNGLGMTENFGSRASNGGCIMYAQGTSSMEYPVKNLRIRWKKENDYFKVRPNLENVEIICMKADYMESSGSHNTGAANLVDDLYPGPGLKTPGQVRFDDPNKRIVTCIKGHPCLIFYSPTGAKGSYEYIGKYNLNLDKATPEPFGFKHADDFGWLPEGEEYWQIQYGEYDENAKVWKDTFIGQKEPTEGADYVKDQVETKATVQPGEKINSIHCFEFLDNAVAVCNFEKKYFDPDKDTTPETFSYRLIKLKSSEYKKNKYYLYNPITKGYELDSSETFDSSKHYFALAFTFRDTWYKKFKNSEGKEVYGWTLGFESRYPEDRVGEHDADPLYPLASWLNELQTLKENDIAAGEWNPTDITYVYDYFVATEYDIGKEYFKPDAEAADGYTKVIIRKEEFENTGPYYNRTVRKYTFKNKALERFKNEYECYLNREFTIFYYLVTEALLMADSRVKNMMIAAWDKGQREYIDENGETKQSNNYIFYPIFYDMDTMLGLDNTGRNRFNYYDEDTLEDLFNGDEVLWFFVRDALANEFSGMYSSLESAGLNIKTDKDGSWLPKSVIPYFNNNQANMANEAFYNGDAVYKYLDPARNGYFDGLNGKNIPAGTGPYLYAAQGDRSLMRENFLINRIKFLRGKYGSSDFRNADQIEFRWNFPSGTSDGSTSGELLKLSAEKVPPTDSFTFTALQPCFAGVMLGKNGNVYKNRFNKEQTQTITVPEGRSANNTEAYLLGLGSLKDLGDLSNKYVQKFVISGDTKLESLILGNPHINYYNPYWSSGTSDSIIDLSGCKYLKYFNLQNCSSFQSGLNFEVCPIIERILLTGSKATSLTLPVNGNVKELRIPSSVKSLYIDSHQYLTDNNFSIGTYKYDLSLENPTIGGGTGSYENDYSELTNVCIINTPINTYNILTGARTLASYYIHGFNWKITNADQDTQYIKMSTDAPVAGTTYYMWNKDTKGYAKVNENLLVDESIWPNLREKVQLIVDNEITRIPILEQLKTKVAKKGQQQVDPSAALIGTIEIAARAKVNQFKLYELYNKTYPNVNIIYNKAAIGENNLTPAFTVKFYNVANVTDEVEPYYQVLTDGNYTLKELISASGPAGVAMASPKRKSSSTVIYTFTGRWKVVGTDTYYDQNSAIFDEFKPDSDLRLEAEFAESEHLYKVTFHNYKGEIDKEVQYSYNQIMTDNPETVLYSFKPDDSKLEGEHWRYEFKGWIGEKDYLNQNPSPDLVVLNTRAVVNDFHLYPFYQPQDATATASNLDYFTFREGDISVVKDYYSLNNVAEGGSIKTERQTYTKEYIIDIKEGYEEILRGKVTIPSRDKNGRYVTAIGNFRQANKIEHLYFLSDSICKIIGDNDPNSDSCSYMTSLNSIYFPENFNTLKIINNSAFNSATALTTIINMPNSIEHIGSTAFSMASELVLSQLPSSLTYIGNQGFFYCRKIDIELLPVGYQQILDSTFRMCDNLKIKCFGHPKTGLASAQDNNITHIGNQAFNLSGKNVSEIFIHSSVSAMDQGCFSGYGSKDNFVIHNGSELFDANSYQNYFGNRSATVVDEIH